MDCFEFEHNDVLLGRENEKEFYEKVLVIFLIKIAIGFKQK